MRSTKVDRRDVALLAARFPGLKPSERTAIARAFESVDEFATRPPIAIETTIGRPLKKPYDARSLVRAVRTDREFLDADGAFFVTIEDPDYPASLREIPDPPYLLWGRGRRPQWDRPNVAVVGTRSPTEEAKRAAFALAADLRSLGIAVVSGLARGIDACAHRGALDSLAVLGNGIDSVYPASNRSLARQMLANGGTILSEYPPGTPALAYHFPARNRIVSGLCRSLVVVQAPAKSGALITAEFALEQGRDVMVHVVGMTHVQGEGTRSLASQGAPTIAYAHEIETIWREDTL